MFNTWLAFKQMSEALQQGRLEDALAHARQPAVRGHQRGAELAKQLGLAFLERAKGRLARGGEALDAWRDVQHAAEVGAEPRLIEKLRGEAGEALLKELRACMDQGPPEAVLERLAGAKTLGVGLPAEQPLEAVARAWQEAQELAQRGELALALAKLEQTAWRPHAAVAAFHAQLQEHLLSFTEKNAELQLAMEDRRWRDVIRLADQLLVIAPHYAPLRRARSLAWKELEPTTLVPAAPAKAAAAPAAHEKQTAGPHAAAGGGVAVLAPPKPLLAPVGSPSAAAEPPPLQGLPRRFILWIDGVGGYLVCLAAKVSLGQASEGAVDIPLFADVSRLHAYISRDSEGYLLEALRPAQVNGKPAEKTLLRDGDDIVLGGGCRLKFHQPVAIANTARLELASRHKLPLSLDGVLLMDETCLFGPSADAHVVVPDLPRPIALLRRKDELIVQSGGAFAIDGKPVKGRGAVGLNSTISGEEFRFSLEPIGPNFGRVRA